MQHAVKTCCEALLNGDLCKLLASLTNDLRIRASLTKDLWKFGLHLLMACREVCASFT